LFFVKHFLQTITHIFHPAAPTVERRHTPPGRFSGRTTAAGAFGGPAERSD
jgi:hypothetical protein